MDITDEILRLIAEIDEFKGAWKAIGRITPERLSNLRYVATIESIGSSTRIEGAKLSDREVERLLSDLEIREFSTQDEQEVAGYSDVMETVFSNFDAIPLIIAIFFVKFLAIHPFQDGNGRFSRILTTLLLLRAGYIYVPYSSLESVVEQSKKSYYLSLRQTQMTLRARSPDWQPWVTYFLNVLKEQKNRLQQKIEKEQILAGSLPELSIKILEIVREHGRITVGEAVKATGANRNTIKDHIKNLGKKGCLEKHRLGRGAWYSLK